MHGSGRRPLATAAATATATGGSSPRLSLIAPLLSATSRLRNVCILAHVDHGKTTLTDSLLASNGIISFKQAGLLRYLDSREDEQQRGITMESSAITLLFDDRRALPSARSSINNNSVGQKSGANNGTTAAVTSSNSINNNNKNNTGSSSVSNIRYCVNLIDSPGHVDFGGQVVTASRVSDGAAVLVDAVEGVCTQTMAVLRQAHRERLALVLVINKIDRLIGELQMAPREAAMTCFRLLEHVNAVYGSIDKEQGCSYFDPVSKGNVVFASALDGWAFTLDQFVHIYSERLPISRDLLRQHLWGPDSHFDAKTRSFVSLSPAKDRPCAFAQLILSNIWSVYNSTSTPASFDKVVSSLALSVGDRERRAALDSATTGKLIMSSWMPLSTALFQVFIDCIPPPVSAASPELPTDGLSCLVAKMFPVQQRPFEAPEQDEQSLPPSTVMIVGMARLFSGCMSVGQTVYVLGSKYDPSKREPGTWHPYTVGQLYLLMGREMEPVATVYSGNVFGIAGGGLDQLIFKSGTISDRLDAFPLDNALGQSSVPLLLRVAIHPVSVGDIEALQCGLQALCQADPCAETYTQSANGEQILAVAGELHLEMCLKDLRERFTRNLDFTVSPPLVPFREAFLPAAGPNRLESLWRDLLCDVAVEDRAAGLLRANFGYATVCLRCADYCDYGNDCDDNCGVTEGGQSAHILSKNIKYQCSLVTELSVRCSSPVASSLCAGFRLAIESGPLASEPVFGVSIVIAEFGVVGTGGGDGDGDGGEDEGEICGRLIADFGAACHAAMMFWSPRLQLAVYSCNIQTSAEYLGRVYGVLGKRRGRVVSEDYNEATGFFTVHSMLPVAESFGFGSDLRGRTSGIAVPQLLFAGFETLDIDPFVVGGPRLPADGRPNEAIDYLMAIRERKGMFVERRIVECAEKQRTLRK